MGGAAADRYNVDMGRPAGKALREEQKRFGIWDSLGCPVYEFDSDIYHT